MRAVWWRLVTPEQAEQLAQAGQSAELDAIGRQRRNVKIVKLDVIADAAIVFDMKTSVLRTVRLDDLIDVEIDDYNVVGA